MAPAKLFVLKILISKFFENKILQSPLLQNPCGARVFSRIRGTKFYPRSTNPAIRPGFAALGQHLFCWRIPQRVNSAPLTARTHARRPRPEYWTCAAHRSLCRRQPEDYLLLL